VSWGVVTFRPRLTRLAVVAFLGQAKRLPALRLAVLAAVALAGRLVLLRLAVLAVALRDWRQR